MDKLEKLLCLINHPNAEFDAKDYVSTSLESLDTQDAIEDVADAIFPFLADSNLVKDVSEVENALRQLGLCNTEPLGSVVKEEKLKVPKSAKTSGKTTGNNSKSVSPKRKTPSPSNSKSPSPTISRPDLASFEYLKLVDPYLNDHSTGIQATTQVSRFHIESVRDSYDTKDVDLPGFSVTVGNLDCIVNSRLKLSPGVAYGLVGRNGVGKSSMLKAIGFNLVVGWPSNVSVLYVEQELVGGHEDCLTSVLAANVQVTQWEKDVARLEEGLSSEEGKQAELIHTIKLERSIAAYRDAWAIAEKRSGARGSEARKVYLEKEQALMALSKKGPAKTTQQHVEDVTWAQEELQSLYTKLSLVDADERSANALRILAGLGFSSNKISAPTKELSGGWRMRLALARALSVDVDILCLDEPTNHLDLPTTLWLIHYLKERIGAQTLLIVSHDRNLLNEIAEQMILIKDKTLKYYQGNYDDFVQQRAEELAKKTKQKEGLERKEQSLKDQIARNIQLAKKSGDDKKLLQATSRKIKFRNFGLNVMEDGKRYKESYHGYRQGVEMESKDSTITFTFPVPDELRTLGPILQLRDISFKYGPILPTVLENITLDVEKTSRIGIVGANGAGKTTLLRILDEQLVPTKGRVEKDARLKIGYFTQQHVDSLDLTSTPLQLITREFNFDKEQLAFDYLGNFGVSGKLALQPISTLSGGQKARLVLANCLFPHPHILLFDEPTNHLDLNSIEALSDAIDEFQGGVVVVSHDVRFLEESCDVIYSLKKGKLQRLPEGGLTDFVQAMAQRVSKRGKTL
jgi:ATP-binding cassette subfamily F protein 3